MRKLIIVLMLCLAALALPAAAEELPLPETPAPETPLEQDPMLLSEVAAENELMDTMVEYINTEAGFSAQYPALFAESSVQMDEAGISGALADGSAFSARRLPRDGATLAAFLETRRQGFEWEAENTDPVTGGIQWLGRTEDGAFSALLAVQEGESDFYVVTLQLPAGQEEAFRLYAEYMTNSLMVDELGIG